MRALLSIANLLTAKANSVSHYMIKTMNKNPIAPMACAIDTLANELIDPAAPDFCVVLADEVTAVPCDVVVGVTLIGVDGFWAILVPVTLLSAVVLVKPVLAKVVLVEAEPLGEGEPLVYLKAVCDGATDMSEATHSPAPPTPAVG